MKSKIEFAATRGCVDRSIFHRLRSWSLRVASLVAVCTASSGHAWVVPTTWPAPTVEQSFDPPYVYVDGVSQMVIRLTNDNAVAITGVQLNDSYPTGMVNAANIPSGVVARNTCGGTVTADPTGTSAIMVGGIIPAHDSCEVAINVTSTWQAPPGGQMTNHTGPVTSANAYPGADATANLTQVLQLLLPAPTVTMSLLPDNIQLDPANSGTGYSVIEIALQNADNNEIDGVQFTMDYPTLANADSGSPGGAVVFNTCATSDHVHAASGTSSLSISNGVVPGSGFCILAIRVSALAAGPAELHTGLVFSANAEPGADATATMNVVSGPLLPWFSENVAFSPNAVAIGGTSQMTVSFVNNDPDNALTGLQFGDVYPPGISNAPSGALVRNTCGGVPSLQANNSEYNLYLINGTIPAGGSCSVVVNVVGTDQGLLTNWISSAMAANAYSPDGASATIAVTGGALLDAPSAVNSFAPTTVAVGEPSQMTIELSNNGNPFQISGAQFTDHYPAGIANVPGTLSDIVVSNTCGGTVTADADGDFVALANGNIPGVGSCSVVVNVIGKIPGAWINQTGPIPSANAQTGTSAVAGINVQGGPTVVAPTVNKAFNPSSISAGDNAQMTITLTNNEQAHAITGVQISDPYPGGMTNAVTGVVVENNTCGGTVTAAQGGSSMALSDGTIPAGSACDIVINIIATAPGAWLNQTTPLTSTNAVSGMAASATLAVSDGTTQQTIHFTSTAPTSATVGGPVYVAAANATSGLPVVLTIDNLSAAVCTINAGTVSFIGAGTCTIDANQSGDATYAPAPQTQQAFTVGAGGTAQTIHFTSAVPVDAVVGGATYLAEATATSNLPVMLTIDSSAANVCTINSGVVTFIGTGTCTIDANQSGNATYAPAPQVQQAFAVTAAGGVTPQTIQFTSTAPNNATVGGPLYLATATATSNLPVTLTIDPASAAVCTINLGLVSFIGTGTCTIDANQGGNATFAPAPQAQLAFTVSAAVGTIAQTIQFTSTQPANATVGGATYLATATASSNLLVNLTIDATASAVCTINAGIVSFTGAGTCTIDANQGGDATYAPAPQVQQSFAVRSGGNGGGNHAPLGVGDALEVAPNSSATALVGDANMPSSVLDNDLDADSDSLTAVKLTDPTHGTLSQFHADGTFVYQSGASIGTDSFTYKSCDAFTCSPPTTVTITIGTGLHDHAPFATDDAIAVAAGATTSALIGNMRVVDSVLDNDIDPDGDVLTAFKLTDPSHGAVALSPDGTFSYQNDDSDPVTNDSFFYAACDTKGACNAGVVTITIGAAGFADHLPVVVDDALQVAQGQFADTLIGDLNDPGSVLDNDHDIDQGDLITAVKMSALLNMSGTVSLNADGTFSYQNIDQQTSSDSLIYEACDTFFACTPGIVTISINNGPLDIAPVAANDASIVAPNSSTSMLVGGASSVLANDSDPGDPLTAHLISTPANGHVTLNADGTFTYYNDDPASGVDSWEYEACDDQGACTAATVSVTLDAAAPTVTCTLPRQLNVVGDTIAIDLSQLFAPPAGQSLVYATTNAPPSLSIAGSLLTGTLQDSDVLPPPYIYNSTLTASTAGTGTSASENVMFEVLPTGEILFRDGFDGGQIVQQPCQ